jgi:hypothetical protein
MNSRGPRTKGSLDTQEAQKTIRSNKSLKQSATAIPLAATVSQGTGIARIVAEGVCEPEEIPEKLVLLLKLDNWRVVPLQMFGYIEYFSVDDNDERQMVRAPFVLIPEKSNYLLEYSVDTEEPDDEREILDAIIGLPLKKGTRLCLISVDEDDPNPTKSPLEVRSIHFI